MEQMSLVFLGGLLTIAGMIIIDRYRRQIRSDQVWNSITLELRELRCLMANVAFSMKAPQGEVTKTFWSWYLPIAQGQEDLPEDIAQCLPKMKEVNEENLAQLAPLFKKPNACYTVNEHSLPFLDAQTTDVGLLSMKKQQYVWRIKMHLDLFNQQTSFLRSQFHRTFDDSLSDTNREGIQTNLNVGYKRLGERAKFIAELISQVIGPAHSVVEVNTPNPQPHPSGSLPITNTQGDHGLS